MKRPILLFDIDYTLIDSFRLRVLTRNEIKKHLNITERDLEKITESYVRSLKLYTDFNAEKYIARIAEKLHTDKTKIRSVFYKSESFAKSLYPETVRVLQKLYANYDLGIYSEGFKDFQTRKLRLSGIFEYFNKKYIFIFRRKTTSENINKLPAGSTVIDDNISVLDKLNSEKKLNLIWLNRQDGNILPEAKTIHDLGELVNMKYS